MRILTPVLALDGHDVFATITQNATSPRTFIVHNIDPGETYPCFACHSLGLLSMVAPPSPSLYTQWRCRRHCFTLMLRASVRSVMLPIMGSALRLMATPDGTAGIRVGKYKYIVGQSPSGWGPNPHPDGMDANLTRNFHPLFAPVDKGPWLFDVEADPSERINLRDTDPVTLKEMQEALARFSKSQVPLRYPHADPTAQPVVVPGLNICTEGMCREVGVWQPWVE